MDGCKICGGLGYRVGKRGDFAYAEPCECVSSCSICGGTGRLERVLDDGTKTMTHCECEGVRRRIRLYDSALIPAHMANKTLADYEDYGGNQSLVKLHVKRYLNSFDPDSSKGILFFGLPGVGKTHLMCAILHHLTLELGVEARFVDFFELLSDIRASFSQGRGAEELLGPLTSIKVLGIDEIGKGRANDWEVSVLDQLVSVRYNRNLKLFGTTNFAPEPEEWPEELPRDGIPETTLLSKVGDRIYSRLVEMCQFVVVLGPDHRRQPAKQVVLR